MKQKEQKNGMNPSQEQFPAVEMRVNRLGTGDGHCLAHLSVPWEVSLRYGVFV